MNIKALAEQAIALAKTAGTILPGLSAGAALAEGVLNVIEQIKPHVDDGTAVELEAAHRELFDAMTAKGHVLSARLRG